MKNFNVIMNGTPLNSYEMDGIFGGDTNINCQNAVLGCCISNHTTECGNNNPSGCLLNSSKLCHEPINLFPCYIANACDPPLITE